MIRSMIKNCNHLEGAIVAQAVKEWISKSPKKTKDLYQQVKNTIMRESFWKKAKAFDELVTPAVKLLRIADDMEDEDGRALEPMGECYYKSFELQEHYKNLKCAEIPKVVMTACSRSFND